MSDTLNELKQRILELESELEAKLEQQRERFHYDLINRKIRFEQDVIDAHRKLKVGMLQFIRHVKPSTLITLPFIYGLTIPLILLDLMASLYQGVCFRIYNIRRVKRRDYFIVDRQHLAYLNGIEKMNCLYCGYATGLIAYVSEIASRTEQFWCPIKHAQRTPAPHNRYWRFSNYGDAQAYRDTLVQHRKELK